MVINKSAGAIIFRRVEDKIYYLVLEYPKSNINSKKEYWGFAKGGIEKNETLKKTAVREIEEETGIKDINIIDSFKEKEKYFFTKNGKKVFKTVIYLLGQTETEKIIISDEHLNWRWLEYEIALKKLTFKNAKDILKKANKFLFEQKTA